MYVRVAVASNDGKTINAHFGQAREFMIFQLTEVGSRYLETRENVPACRGQEHDDNGLEASVLLLADCQGVVVSQIGPGAIDILIEQGILPFTMSGVINEGLQALINSRRLKHFKIKDYGK